MKLAFLHTSHVLIPLFSKLASDIIPEVQVFHLTDESLIRNTIAAGQLTRTTTRRLVNMIESAHDGGADAVMVTCSSIGEAAEHYAFERVDAAVWKIDLWARARRRPGVHPSVTAALARAHDAGVVTVAKAVEDAETLAAVGDLGFDRAFGHAVSPAVTPSAMEALLRRPRRDALG